MPSLTRAVECANALAREKRMVGERRAQTTGQRFVLVEKRLNDMDMAQQIRSAVIGTASA